MFYNSNLIEMILFSCTFSFIQPIIILTFVLSLARCITYNLKILDLGDTFFFARRIPKMTTATINNVLCSSWETIFLHSFCCSIWFEPLSKVNRSTVFLTTLFTASRTPVHLFSLSLRKMTSTAFFSPQFLTRAWPRGRETKDTDSTARCVDRRCKSSEFLIFPGFPTTLVFCNNSCL